MLSRFVCPGRKNGRDDAGEWIVFEEPKANTERFFNQIAEHAQQGAEESTRILALSANCADAAVASGLARAFNVKDADAFKLKVDERCMLVAIGVVGCSSGPFSVELGGHSPQWRGAWNFSDV
ncbi:unnamed protein product [Amoebophrya sp. A25]|nr:unnamed protein product [Amoebophrya sp. A25]|eukprot:GSA25T00019565001.1